MNQGLIPRRYAKALYKFAFEKGKQDRVYELMNRLVSMFESNPDLNRTLGNPFIPVKDKEALVSTAAGADSTDAVFADFIKLLVNNRRIDMTRDIALAYLDIYRSENNIYVVRVTSAAPMSQADESRLKQLIERHLHGAKMEYTSQVNPDLIGGFSVEVGNERIDASISNELKLLRLNLLSK
ncbi:MAG: F0F1 ATP synthase subunit delta [Muribaculaceae bacterium]|nr:F0F1 ATP synthase subunit delta [Muribaculaceae bacterium]